MYMAFGFMETWVRRESQSSGSTKNRGTKSNGEPFCRRNLLTVLYSLSLRPSSHVPGKWFMRW